MLCVALLCLLCGQARQMVPAGHTGEWHFCRGLWDSEGQRFKSYSEIGKQAAMEMQHSLM